MNNTTVPRLSTEADRPAEPDTGQSDFAARCDASLATYERTGHAIPADVVFAKLEAKVAARIKALRA